MKLEYEQKLAEEKTNYGILEGQLMVCLTSRCARVHETAMYSIAYLVVVGPSSHQACKKEIDELNRQLFEKTRIVEEYQVKENSLAQVRFHHV
jgi:hypothetical protein